MFDQRLLAGAVPLVLAVELGHGHVGLVDDHEEVFGEVVEEGEGLLAGVAPVEVPGVVLDTRAHPHLAEHLQVVGGAHPQTLGLEELAARLQGGQAVLELVLDLGDGPLHAGLGHHVVGGGEHAELVQLLHHLARHRVDGDDPFHLVAEELDPDGPLLVGGEQLDGVAPDPELVADEVHVVALVGHVDELGEDGPLVALLPHLQHEELGGVLLGGTQAVDGRHRGHDDHVPPGQQGRGGGVAQPVDLVVDRAVLLDIGVGRGDVGLGLVVVVVGDEVLHPVLGEEVPELAGQLGGQALVGGEHQRRPLHPGDGAGDGEGLARPGDAQQSLEPVAGLDAPGQRVDGRRLVAGGGEIGDKLERRHPVASYRRGGTVSPGPVSLGDAPVRATTSRPVARGQRRFRSCRAPRRPPSGARRPRPGPPCAAGRRPGPSPGR